MESKNLGLLIAPPRPKDYVLGGISSVNPLRQVKDWSIYLPAVESQRNKVTDFLDCVSMSGPDHSIATQLNYLLSTNQLSNEALNYFHNNNYIVDGLFSLSSRFNAKLNGTDKNKGQYLNVAADCVRRDGVIAELDWATTDAMGWDEFYKDVPSFLLPKGQKFKWFIDVSWQWVATENLPEALKLAPVQIAAEVCAGWDSGLIVHKCSGQPLQHATMIYGQDNDSNWLDLDHYPPYKQSLAKDYELPLNLQYIVTVKPLTLRNGMNGSNVLQLQQKLNKLGFILKEDSDFGLKTETQVRSFQNKTGLTPDGIAGPKTLAKLDQLLAPKTLMDVLIQVESGGDDYAEGDKTLKDHAYGCLQIRQGVCDAVNNFFGTDFLAQDCLGKRIVSVDIWNKYWKVYPSIVTNEDRARTWNGGPGWRQIYFKPNKTDKEKQYCVNLDIYWKKVEALL